MDIIIVEDDYVTATALQVQLNNMGHHVVGIVDNYDAAVQIPSKKNVDLALLDINLIGKKTGVDIARIFQNKYNLPCIFLTSTSNDFIINQVREIGVYGYLLKPISNKDLFTAIEIAEVRFKNDQLNNQKTNQLEELVANRTLELKAAKDQLEEEIQFTLKLQKDLEDAEVKERKRIAADLHDGVCQKLTAAKFSLGAICRTLKLEGEMDNLFRDATKLIEGSLTEIREISHRLTPSEIETRGLIVALHNMFDRLNDLNVIEIHFEEKALLPSLSVYKETVIYRTIQEAINNIIKHAQATRVEVIFQENDDELEFIVKDNGMGIHLHQINQGAGIGLKNIRERCKSIGATICISGECQKGTTVQLTLKKYGHEQD